jgi:hypothetical protein
MFGLHNEKLEASVKALRAMAEQRAAFLSVNETDGSQIRDNFYDTIATFAEEALKEIERAKIGF